VVDCRERCGRDVVRSSQQSRFFRRIAALARANSRDEDHEQHDEDGVLTLKYRRSLVDDSVGNSRLRNYRVDNASAAIGGPSPANGAVSRRQTTQFRSQTARSLRTETHLGRYATGWHEIVCHLVDRDGRPARTEARLADRNGRPGDHNARPVKVVTRKRQLMPEM
jgi:hypothetical protein